MVALIVAGLALVVEVFQFVLGLGRVASVDDILLNTLGALVASVASVAWWRSRLGPD